MKNILNLYNISWKRVIKTSSIEAEVVSSYNKIFILILILFFFPSNLWLSQVPDALYNPPILSIAVFFSGFPNYTTLLILHILLVICLVLIGLDKFKVTMGILAFLLIILISSIKFGFGKIEHQVMLPITLLCFSLSNWKSIKENKNHFLPIPPETLLAIFISFGMFTAGFLKLFNWIDFDVHTSGFLFWFYDGYYSMGRTHLLAPLVFKMPPSIVEILDYVAVMFELSPFIILLIGKRIYWKIWILSACFFHLNTLLLLNINFTIHILAYLPFIIPLSMIHFFKKLTSHRINLLIIIIGTVQILSLIFINKSMLAFLVPDNKTNLYLALLLWVLTILIGMYGLFSYKKEENKY